MKFYSRISSARARDEPPICRISLKPSSNFRRVLRKSRNTLATTSSNCVIVWVLHLQRHGEIPEMSVNYLLKSAAADTEGPEVVLRVVGNREPPARMVIQIAIVGSATVQIQGRIARDAPWQCLGPAHREGALLHVDAVQFLRAVASGVTANSTVSVWAVWAW